MDCQESALWVWIKLNTEGEKQRLSKCCLLVGGPWWPLAVTAAPFCSSARGGGGGGDDGERGWQALHGVRKQLQRPRPQPHSVLMIGGAFRVVLEEKRCWCVVFLVDAEWMFALLASFVWRLHKHPLYLAHLFLSVCRSLTCLWGFFSFLSCSSSSPDLFLGPSADLHFLRLCLPRLVQYSLISGSLFHFPCCSSVRSLLLLLKGFPHFLWSCFYILIFLQSLQVCARFSHLCISNESLVHTN